MGTLYSWKGGNAAVVALYRDLLPEFIEENIDNITDEHKRIISLVFPKVELSSVCYYTGGYYLDTEIFSRLIVPSYSSGIGCCYYMNQNTEFFDTQMSTAH